jgi:hypothetical protein
MFQKLKDIFNNNHKNIKFYALIFVIIVLLTIAISPGITNSNSIVESSDILTTVGKNMMTRVRFAIDPVTNIHSY